MRLSAAGVTLNRSLRRSANLIGWALLVVWCIWWADNLAHGRMSYAESTWIRLPGFGVDFLYHVQPVQTWAAGGDAYADKQKKFHYPPIAIRLFMWSTLTSFERSVRIWICLAAIFAAVGAVAAARSRRQLGLGDIPDSLAVAMLLFSTPVLFALERSNYDLLIVPCVVVSVLLMHRKSVTTDVVAGLLLAVVIWAKLYPGLLFLAVVALQRWRLACWLVVWTALIGLSDLPELFRFAENLKLAVEEAHR